MSDALALPLLLAVGLLSVSCVGLSVPTARLQRHISAAERKRYRGKMQIMVVHSCIVNRTFMYKVEFVGIRFYYWNIVLPKEKISQNAASWVNRTRYPFIFKAVFVVIELKQ